MKRALLVLLLAGCGDDVGSSSAPDAGSMDGMPSDGTPPDGSVPDPDAALVDAMLDVSTADAMLDVGRVDAMDAMDAADIEPDIIDATTDLGPDAGPPPPGARPGGAATTDADGRDAFREIIPGLDGEARRAFSIGEALFDVDWVPEPGVPDDRDGLGPLYNATACGSCHPGGGRGAPPIDGAQAPVSLLIRVGVGPDGTTPDEVYGDQIQTRAVPGLAPEARVRVEFDVVEGAYGDGTPYSLLVPRYLFDEWSAGEPAVPLSLSPRIASPLIGLGLLEAVPEAEITAGADPDDLDGDGISGRVNRVRDVETGLLVLGRFGWKANQPSLRQQTAAALAGDIGITSSLLPDENCTQRQVACLDAIDGDDPEINDRSLDALVDFGRYLGVPRRPRAGDAEVRAGEDLFHRFGCAACHQPMMMTGVAAEAPLSEQPIWPYTDLLLHDMGPGLADGRGDGLANSSEWRTPPLWGIGRTLAVSGHTRFLHDGRARSLAEAVLWHDGEGRFAREAFRTADAADRARLIGFLESL